jgi:hypothetical protein
MFAFSSSSPGAGKGAEVHHLRLIVINEVILKNLQLTVQEKNITHESGDPGILFAE